MSTPPINGLSDYKFTPPQDDAEWLVVDLIVPDSGQAEAGPSSSFSPEPTATDPAAWSAFCGESPRPLAIVDDSTAHSPTAQESILSPAAPEPAEVAVVNVQPVQTAQPTFVNYYPLWSGRGARGAGHRGRPRVSHVPPPQNASTSSGPVTRSQTRGLNNGRRGGTKNV